MGQYHHAVNLDKREYLNPHDMGLGLKQWEQVHERMALALIALLSCSNGRGGGDLPEVDGINGRWAGDRVVFVGDYTEPGDVEGFDGIENVYGLCNDPTEEDIVSDEIDLPEGETFFTNITPLIVNFIERAEDGLFVGAGWRQWVQKDGRVSRWSDDHNSREKLHGTVTALDHDTRNFTIAWDNGPTVEYNGEGQIPYLMASDVPGPRMSVDMVVTA